MTTAAESSKPWVLATLCRLDAEVVGFKVRPSFYHPFSSWSAWVLILLICHR